MLFWGMRGEVWLEPGASPGQAVEHPAWISSPSSHNARVVLVLGAGNVAMLPVADFLSLLFGEGHVVLLKMNPVNAYLGPIYQQAFEPILRRGYLRIVYGGAEAGAYLCNHPQIDAVHLTGSDKTYEAIMFGPGAQGAARKAARQPLLDKPVTAELGGVNPVIVIPGPWSRRQLRRQALQLAGFLYSNASFSCLTPRVVIQPQGWSPRHQFLDAVGAVLQQAGTRPAYYPGAEARYQAFLYHHPEAQRFGQASAGCLPWTIVRDVDPAQPNDPIFRSESFCSILGETALPANSIVEYLCRAVEFANHVLWGTLTATILVHPSSLKDPAVAAALERAQADLRYGTITVNAYPALAYVLMLMPWGAYPGHTPFDIQSGVGKINNFYYLRQPQKAIFRAPFDGLQAGGLTSRHSALFGRELATALARPSWRTFPALTRAALLAL
jgi:acyl-CoA reductase-like NAD-dependent aldehyde dehydrogenase